MPSGSDIRLLYARELKSALRERNIVVNSILLPIFLYPVLLWLVYTGITFVGGQTEGFSSRVVLKGLPATHQLLKTDLEQDKQIEIKESSQPDSDIQAGKIDLLIEFLPAQGPAASLPGNFQVRLTYDNSKDRSSIARNRLSEKIRRYRDIQLDAEAKKLGMSPAQLRQYWVEDRNVATSKQMGQFILGLMLPLFLIIMLSVGCMYPAIDSTAGEREKSTWETLMTVATPRKNIVIAKYLYVASMSSIAGILNLTAMVLSMKSIMAPLLGKQSEGFTFQIPLRSLPLILLVTVLLALFISAGMMILASFARTFKEGQGMVSPFYIATFLPVMFLQAPGLELTPTLALIPIVNVAMVFREAVAGIYRWPLIGITIAIELICIALCLWLAVLIIRYEDFMLGTYGGSFNRFLKERLLARKSPSGGILR
ncbi:MAG TPA: ABC transporter permease [Acidobacteriota bacterium]|nr:ABC transporter permease [Acidobacteriota bacterium]